MNVWLDALGHRLAEFLSQPRQFTAVAPATTVEQLLGQLEPADVLLVEGTSRVSTAIKFLTQSTWSHAAIFAGVVDGSPRFVEADMVAGVRLTDPLAYAGLHARICRPISLADDDRARVVGFVLERLGHRYDLRNVVDLARYLLPTPPVPVRLRRKLIALGSGDPTRAICSTLIAQAFQSVRYPILPNVVVKSSDDPACESCSQEVLRIRHHSLFTPRDFDVSPYFDVIKPSTPRHFDYRTLVWDLPHAVESTQTARRSDIVADDLAEL